MSIAWLHLLGALLHARQVCDGKPCNTIFSKGIEFGLVVPQGIRHVFQRVPDLIGDASNELPGRVRLVIQRLLDHLKVLDGQVCELEFEQWPRSSELSKRIETIQ